MKSSELVKTKVSKYGHAKGTSCLNEYLDKKETEASPVSDRDAVLCIAQCHPNNVHEREIQMFKMTKVTTK